MTDAPPPHDPYAQQPPAPHGNARPPGKGLAIGALVVGVLALLLSITVIGGIVLGLVAIVLGFVASSRAKKGRAGGRGLAITGIVLGVLGLVIGGALLAVGAAFFNSDEAQQYADCLEQAGSDTAAVESCNSQFEDQVNQRFGN